MVFRGREVGPSRGPYSYARRRSGTSGPGDEYSGARVRWIFRRSIAYVLYSYRANFAG